MSNGTKIAIAALIILLGIYAFFALDIPYRSSDEASSTPITGGTNSAAQSDLPFLTSPASGAAISSPVHMTGEARGNWYFEASFPIEIVSANGTVLGTGHSNATSDWMTANFVPFTADISFNAGSSSAGFIRIKNDNPSGDPARDKHFDIPVMFATSSKVR
ncbi:MAG TPA: Gmad2 immunoglobulin-like domain-containing protein [Candidatus Paceibacterota bacterium]|nr:Gmad2 immunoglobulin-like domain-containing protein [Candidatus Paceibacterota bacterium]